MMNLRPSRERGLTALGWLNSRHSFSFGDYYDKAHMGFRSLRVINEDLVTPSAGFGEHGHRDMEIITVVTKGALRHADSLGNSSVIVPGDTQRMTAGTGIFHSEFNGSDTEAVEFVQIWLLPEVRGLKPSYDQKHLPHSLQPGVHLLAAPDGEGAVRLNHSARLYRVNLGAGQEEVVRLPNEHHAWAQVLEGSLTIGDLIIEKGDGVAISDEAQLTFRGKDRASLLLFDLA